MTAVEPYDTFGTGWTATVQPARIELHIEQLGDPLPSAVLALLAPDRRGNWSVLWTGEDSEGRDVYVMDLNPTYAIEGNNLVTIPPPVL